MDKKIEIGFLIDNTVQLYAWEYEALKQLLEWERCEVVLIKIETDKSLREGKSSKHLFFRWFQKFEEKWFRSIPDAFKRSNPPHNVKAVKIIDANDFDIIFNTRRSLQEEKISLPTKHGTWSISFGHKDYQDVQPIGFWEVMHNETVIGSSLKVKLTNRENEFVVYEGTTNTVPHSVRNTVNMIAWRTSSFLLHRIKEFAAIGADRFIEKYSKNIVEKRTGAEKVPANPQMFLLFMKNIFGYFFYKWRVFLRRKKKFQLFYQPKRFDLGELSLEDFKPMPLPEDCFWGDPFLIEKDNCTYIFFEEFLYSKGKAHISVMEMDKNGMISIPRLVLEKPYHLSYPFVFGFQDTYYMIPETSANKTVDLYKAKTFPGEWEFVINLMKDITLIDPTLFFHNNKWWLFGTTINHEAVSTNDQLMLYHSSELFSKDWIPHPQNPVATHISNCRPAGKIFAFNNKIYRPAQNNASIQYGFSIKINEIEILNEYEYVEKEVFELLPSNKNKFIATHSLNFTEKLIVIDGIR